MRWTTWIRGHLLLIIDRLFGTHFLDRELARYQVRIDALVERVDVVSQEIDTLAEALAAYRLTLCLIELQIRSERADLDDWLCFAPGADDELEDEGLLDSVIDCLVKPRLATVDVEPMGEGRYLYRVHPDWSAIQARLKGTQPPSELLAWLDTQAA